GWEVVYHPPASGGPAVSPGHGRLGAALVEEDEPPRVNTRRPLPPVPALLDDLWVALLLGPQGLFFRVISSRASDRHTVIRQPPKPIASRSSSSVASGASRTAARNDSAASP